MAITIEWESDTTRLVRLTGLPRSPLWPKGHGTSSGYYKINQRRIRRIYLHQSAGSSRDGIEAPTRIAEWIIKAPRYKVDEAGNLILRNGRKIWIGGGRGFPAEPYSFVIPTRPTVEDGRSVVYRCWDDEWVTWHTRRGNRTGVGVCFAGKFATRHAPQFSDQHPTTSAMAAGADLILNYLIPRYNLTLDDLSGHFEMGKPTCPGDALEAWVRERRGEGVDWFHGDEDVTEPELDNRDLYTQKQRIRALRDLGFDAWWDLNEPEGYRLAIEAVQLAGGATVDGIYGPQSERVLRQLLAEWAAGA